MPDIADHLDAAIGVGGRAGRGLRRGGTEDAYVRKILARTSIDESGRAAAEPRADGFRVTNLPIPVQIRSIPHRFRRAHRSGRRRT